MKNKKGFTLVELLAVIVILALIMGIAVVSIGGVLTSSREKTFRETAASLINGVRQQLYIENKIAEGDYCVTAGILEKGGTESPYGNNYKYDACTGENIGSAGTVKKMASNTTACNASATTFVRVTQTGGNFEYKICLSDGKYWLNLAKDGDLITSSGTPAPIQTPAS